MRNNTEKLVKDIHRRTQQGASTHRAQVPAGHRYKGLYRPLIETTSQINKWRLDKK